MQGCSGQGQFYYNESTGMVASKPSGCLALAQGGKCPQVVLEAAALCGTASPANGWKRGPEIPGPPGRASRVSLQSVGLPGQCMTVGPIEAMPVDPWCTTDVNMWRSNTDSLQVWGRMMDELESLVGLGTVSQPGSWCVSMVMHDASRFGHVFG